MHVHREKLKKIKVNFDGCAKTLQNKNAETKKLFKTFQDFTKKLFNLCFHEFF